MTIHDLVLGNQLDAFVGNMSRTPVPLVQDMRAGSIALISLFAKNAIDLKSVDKLLECVGEIRLRDDYHSNVWWQVAYLEVAMSLLTNDVSGIKLIAGKISHGTRSIRNFLYVY